MKNGDLSVHYWRIDRFLSRPIRLTGVKKEELSGTMYRFDGSSYFRNRFNV
jgi:hypothetical protein